MKKLLLCMSAMLFLLAGCNADTKNSSDDTGTAPAAENNVNPDSGNSGISVSDENTIIITLYPETAPITCENFETLVSEGFYNGLTFHRVVDNFMAQGGDPLGNGTGGSPDTIKGEFSSNGVENNLSHQRGVISMARSAMNDSASSQFFICYTDCSFLDGSYAAFGEVTQGMEVVDSFLEVPRSYNSSGELAVPDSPVTMKEVTMIDPDENGNPRVQIIMDTIPVAE
ncbi:MAG: peptidylprolyl isomerase [Oscillospiraceae bacterium]|nr:peptidylprolyl isomerase [Oscillospiraceae bacterium]